jgi:alkylhydroperoxidase/carboxymuconolactone decarboxylase family protein YurZ
MKHGSEPPKKYTEFIERFPKLGEAWEAIHEAEAEGPLDPRTARLIKLAVAIGAFKEGTVHAATRKALKAGVTAAELHQVVALSAATLGMPSTVAAYCWIQDVLERDEAKGEKSREDKKDRKKD